MKRVDGAWADLTTDEAWEKALAYLADPARKKTTGVLEDIEDGDCRCCLGHVCAALGAHRTLSPSVERVYYAGRYDHDFSSSGLPQAIAERLGILPAGEFLNPIEIPMGCLNEGGGGFVVIKTWRAARSFSSSGVSSS